MRVDDSLGSAMGDILCCREEERKTVDDAEVVC
jgi:hypothetical protein